MRLAGLTFFACLSAATAAPLPVHIRIDVSNTQGELNPIWRFFGADEPNYAYMPHGKKLLAELGSLGSAPVYFRAHNLLTSGDGTPALKWGSTGVYTEDPQGHPVYDWSILDRIFDTYRAYGLRPYAEIGFMPEQLSVKPEPYQHRWSPQAPYGQIFTGWAYPPKDYTRWADLVFAWTKHCVERYGSAEVERWWWEVWNEPNIGYWRGTLEEFLKLHDYAVDAVRRALPSARVGGPDTAGSGGPFTRRFLDHCLHGTNYATGKVGTPLDFVSFHAKGAPSYVDGHVRMGIAQQLRTVDDGFQIIRSFPELKGKPIVIGECDPEGCAACQGSALAYRNSTMYSSYTAACFGRLFDLAEKDGVPLEGALTWAFEFEDQPFFAGFRSLASNGIDKPVLNVFRMFGKMQGQRVSVRSDGAVELSEMLKEGVRSRPDVSGLATVAERQLWILLWHYHDDDVPGPEAAIELEIEHMSHEAHPTALRHFRIDSTHSNAYTAWQKMDSPQQPTAAQVAELEQAAQLTEVERPQIQLIDGQARVRLDLPRQAVSLLQVQLESL